MKPPSAVLSAIPSAVPLGAAVRPADLVALAKPRITLLVLITAAGGLWLAPTPLPLVQSLIALLGIALVVCGANALNMYLEREIDGRVARTKNRPLPAGRLHPAVALGFGAALALFSIPLMTLGVNPLTGLLGLVSFCLYVMVYTPLKQRSSLSLMVGAIPGAMPPLMGWVAATGTVDRTGLVLFGIMFLWQIPHFLAISLYRQQEMARAGYKVLSVERGDHAAKLRVVLYSAALVPVSLLLYPLHIAGRGYFVVALLSGLVFLGWAVRGLRKDAGPRWARTLFQLSLLYVVVVFAALGFGRL